MKFILMSVVVCVGMLVSYDLAIRISTPARSVTGENQWSDNIISAQEIIYRSDIPNTIIVGSSLAFRLRPRMFGGSIYNLAFNGKSTFDGLRILEAANRSPILLLVETNSLFRQEDSEFTDQIFRQPMNQLRRYFPGLRERNRPLNDLRMALIRTFQILNDIGVSALDYWLEKLGYIEENDTFVEDNELLESQNNSILNLQIERHVKYASVVPEFETTQRILQQLFGKLELLRSSGTKIVLFEMPMDSRVCDAHGKKYFRKAIASFFPTETYIKIPLPPCGNYRTTDGIHLPYDQAKLYARYMASELDKYGLTIGGEIKELRKNRGKY